MKRLFIWLIAATAIATDMMADALGTWKIFPSYHVCTYNIPVGKRVYALMESKLMAYDSEDQSTTTFDWQNQLNDINIHFIAHSAEAKRILIVYENSNIDLLSTEDDNDVINLNQLKKSTLSGKDVNNVDVQGKRAYLSTGFGLVVIDMEQGFITNTYNLGEKIAACTADDQYIYVSANSGIMRGRKNQNLQDKSKWQLVNEKLNATRLMYFDSHLFATTSNTLHVSETQGESFSQVAAIKASFAGISDDCLIVGNKTDILIYNKWNASTTIKLDNEWNWLAKNGNTYWVSEGYEGLQAYTLADKTFQLTTSKIHPNSPLHDYTYLFKYIGDRLFIAGGNRNYSSTSRPGTAMVFEPDGTWTHFDYKSATTAFPNERFIDVTQIVQDPKDANHFYIGTARSGIFEFRDYKCVGHLGLDNSPLQSILPNNSRPHWFTVADGITYDGDGNLWVLNCTEGRADTTLRIMRPDGSWTGIPCPEIKSASTIDKIFFDSKGRAWLNSRRMNQRGIYLLDYNKTIDNRADDYRKLRSEIINQDGTSYKPNGFFCITEDQEGQIWFGTEIGPFVINNPDEFINDNFTFEQVKVARNDGSGLADYLLSNVPIQCIAIDSGNRKWFGTQNNGVYLMSEDCQEEIYHFTVDNSPLTDNEVSDIAINHHTGEVFFATAKGLCSYMSDATNSVDDLDDDQIFIYPNPVDPDYHGPISVRGLQKDCEVKIVSTAGQLIWSGKSNGGFFSWNGCNANGRRVASGIYHIIVSTADGKKAAVSRIAFIR